MKKKIEMTEELTPIIHIDTKNIKATYYHGGSGFIEITDDEGYQVFCVENGTLTTQIGELKQTIKNAERNIKWFKKGLMTLTKLQDKNK